MDDGQVSFARNYPYLFYSWKYIPLPLAKIINPTLFREKKGSLAVPQVEPLKVLYKQF